MLKDFFCNIRKGVALGININYKQLVQIDCRVLLPLILPTNLAQHLHLFYPKGKKKTQPKPNKSTFSRECLSSSIPDLHQGTHTLGCLWELFLSICSQLLWSSACDDVWISSHLFKFLLSCGTDRERTGQGREQQTNLTLVLFFLLAMSMEKG